MAFRPPGGLFVKGNQQCNWGKAGGSNVKHVTKEKGTSSGLGL